MHKETIDLLCLSVTFTSKSAPKVKLKGLQAGTRLFKLLSKHTDDLQFGLVCSVL